MRCLAMVSNSAMGPALVAGEGICATGKNRATAAAQREGRGMGGVGVWRKGDRRGTLGRKFDWIAGPGLAG